MAVTTNPISFMPKPSDNWDMRPYIDKVMIKNKYKLINVNVMQVAVPVSLHNLLKRNQSAR